MKIHITEEHLRSWMAQPSGGITFYSLFHAIAGIEFVDRKRFMVNGRVHLSSPALYDWLDTVSSDFPNIDFSPISTTLTPA